MLAYQSAWLRQRYPAEFLAALLNAQPMGFYPPASLVRDAQRRGVRVLPPCIAPLGGDLHRGGRRRARSASATCARCAGRPPSAWWPSARPTGPSATSPTWRRAPTCAASSSPSSCGRAPATSSSARARAMLWELGVLARPRDGRRAACSSPCRSPPARPPRSPSSGASSARSPTTRPPASPPAGTWWRWCAPGCRPACSPPPSCARPPTARGVLRGRPGGGPPAARDRRGHRLPAAGGRDRHGQLHRAARGLRAPPGRGAGRAPAAGLGAPGAAGARP